MQWCRFSVEVGGKGGKKDSEMNNLQGFFWLKFLESARDAENRSEVQSFRKNPP